MPYTNKKSSCEISRPHYSLHTLRQFLDSHNFIAIQKLSWKIGMIFADLLLKDFPSNKWSYKQIKVLNSKLLTCWLLLHYLSLASLLSPLISNCMTKFTEIWWWWAATKEREVPKWIGIIPSPFSQEGRSMSAESEREIRCVKWMSLWVRALISSSSS